MLRNVSEEYLWEEYSCQFKKNIVSLHCTEAFSIIIYYNYSK